MISFLLFTFLFSLVGSSLMVVIVKNPIHSILFLVLVFFNSSAILLILGFEFVALIFIIIYVGAIAVLFLFVIMMLNIRLLELNDTFFKFVPLSFIFFIIFVLELIFILMKFSSINFLELIFSNSDLNNTFNLESWDYLFNAKENLQSLGSILFTYKSYLFLLAGFILFLAMIGAIVLVFNDVRLSRKQLIFKQVYRNSGLILINNKNKI